ncbi:MAG: tetratricopeptide repeat protein [Planktothrix agardhii LY1]|jgi:tetratricopeptide (TPR) repeat protein|uniref:tetratricopeptide repeat protein n=1 Tax=Planktothrix agardhii TaxID=1160 RepID=UPI00242F2953|nr:tetratricopeptide repeat protein [Planktothrix agardhii]MCP9296747.1 tetratricopeptide repeat protein [Planktothrix agardhii LY1]
MKLTKKLLAQFKKAIELDGKNGDACRYLGDALVKLGRWDEAIDAYERSLKVNPDDFMCYVGLGDAWLGKGMVEKAITSYQKAIELNPDLVEVYDKLGDSLAKVGRQKEASVSYRRGLEVKAKVS